MEHLELLQLQKLRESINSIDSESATHTELKKLLKKEYGFDKKSIDEVITLVEEKRENNEGFDPIKLKEINLYVALLNLRPRNYNPENPDLKKLKQLVNNKIFQVKKALNNKG